MSKYLLFIPLDDVNSAHSVASRDLFLILSRLKKNCYNICTGDWNIGEWSWKLYFNAC